jgi:hypothetical protein
MSGYLQRLASSAARTERRVQPLVGGLFARQPEQAIEEATTTIIPQPASPASEHPLADSARTTLPRISSDESRMEETVLRSTHVEPLAPMPEEPRRKPLPALVEQDSSFSSQRKERVERTESPAHRTERPAVPDLLVALSKFIERPADPQRSTADKIQTLAGETAQTESAKAGDAQAHEPIQTERLRPASAGSMRTIAQPPAGQSRTPSPMREGSDDIQIHIGRIEVIAVQPPAPHPAAVPTRRGPTLEEYLRRDRRSR